MTDQSERVSKQETEIAFSGPALASNRFYVHAGPWVRIAFAEQTPDISPVFRTAVVLSAADAISLADLIKTLESLTE